MTLKINWGTGIFLFYLAFVVFMLSLVVMSINQQIDLVTDDYYAQGVAYQNVIEEQKNVAVLAEKPRVREIGKGIAELRFTHQEAHKIQGTVTFFRPSDKNLDFTIPLNLKSLNQEGEQVASQIINRNLKSGLWRVKLSWKESGKNFFHEAVLVISE